MEQKEIGLSEREVERFGVLERLRHGELSQVDASRSLGLSSRQVRRLLRRLERDGAAGLRSGRRGGKPN
ncbi:MAG: helix-turn-helix domain-containing protein, partial [Zoogloeaceae bacterium]|nr:helix-turn-helix domain-containing protein [Zoogloeaceae bacterium]